MHVLCRLTALGLCLAVFLTGTAAFAQGAADKTQVTKPIYPWKTETSQTSAKGFSHCLTKNMYDNGILVLIAENAKRQRRLALHFPQDKLNPGDSYDLQWQVDRQDARPITAVAASPRILAIAIDDKMTQHMARGNMLFLRGPNDTLIFDMIGVGDAVQSLHNCLVTNGIATGPVNFGAPLPPASATAPAPVAADPSSSNLSPAIANLFSRAGLKPENVMVVPIAQRQEKPFDAVWMQNDLFIGFRSEAPVPRQALPQFAARFTGRMQELCGGEFLAEGGQVEQHGKSYVMPAEVACSPSDPGKGKSTVAALLFAVNSNALHVFFIEAPDSQGSQAVQYRDKIQGLIQ